MDIIGTPRQVPADIGAAMALGGYGGAISMTREARAALEDPLLGQQPALPVLKYSGLVAEFRSEVDASKIVRSERETCWQITHANYEMKSLAPSDGQTSTAFYARFGQVLDDFTSDMLRMLDPKADYIFDTRFVGEDDEVDTELSDIGKKLVKRALDRADWSKTLRSLVIDAGFYGEAFVHGPIAKPAHVRDWRLVEDGKIVMDQKEGDAVWFEHLPVLDTYPDASAKTPDQIGHVNVRRVWMRHELEKMLASNDKAVQAEELKALLALNSEWSSAGWWDTDSTGDRKFVIWNRIGFLSQKQVEEMQALGVLEKKDISPRAVFDLHYTESGRLIRAAVRKSQPGKLPVYMARVRWVPGKLHGMSIMENLHGLVDVMNNLFREIDNQSGDLSGVNAVIDPAGVENNDYSIKGRKTWIRRRSTILPDAKPVDPVSFLAVPNNLGQLVSTLEAIEQRIDRVSGLPSYAAAPRESLGSGIRTIGQQEQLWEAAQRFIRLVVGNWDEELTEPVIDSLMPIVLQKMEDRLGSVKAVYVVAQGMQGAIRREIVGRRFIQMYLELANSQQLGWIKEARAIKLLTEFSGLQDEQLAKTLEEREAEIVQQMQQKILEEKNAALARGAAEAHIEKNYKAQSSVVDTMLQQFKSLPPNDPTGPVLQEQIMELTGKASPRLYAALAIKTRMIAALAAQAGAVLPGESEVYTAPFGAESPLELEAGSDPMAPPPPANAEEATRDQHGEARDFMNTPTALENTPQLQPTNIPEEGM